MRNRITIGISSIIFIFMILCLSVFSLLSLSDAKSALTFAQRRADTVQSYYETDAFAQTWIRDYRKLYSELNHAEDVIARLQQDMEQTVNPVSTPPLVSFSENETVISEFPMQSGQTLYLELCEDGSEILSYYVYNSTDYEINSDLPVWGGN